MPTNAATQAASPAVTRPGFAPPGYAAPPLYSPQPGYPPPAYPPGGAAAPAWPQPPAKQSKNITLAIGGVVLVALIAAGAVFYLNRSHPISLPPSAGGLSEITTLTSSEKSALKDAETDLGKRAHIHDIASRYYGELNGSGYFVIAGHINASDASIAGVENQVAATATGAGAAYQTGKISSGGTDYECVWASGAGHSVAVCFWWSNHSLLVGEGIGFDAQSTADALAEVRAYGDLT